MIFEKLSEEEIQTIDFMRKNESYSHTSDFFRGDFINCKSWLKYWERAKTTSLLSDPFENSLILKKRITTTAEDDELYRNMNNVLYCSECKNLEMHIRDMLAECNDDFADWKENYINGIYASFSLRSILRNNLFDSTAFVKNIYDGPSIEVKCYNNTTIKFVKGQKVMKIIGRLANAVNLRADFEHVRIAQSQIMNQAHITANLCISIHPLDYMTASYNSNNWRSCMCWEDGEYRRGVIEMMNSSYVVVAYLESDKQKLDMGCGYIWNSKKWREFFIVNRDIITGIKGYPYWNRDLEDEVLKWLKELYAPVFNVTYDDAITTYNIDTALENKNGLISFSCGPAMYNDFYNGNNFHGFFAEDFQGERYFDYSGASECACCGEDYDFDSEGEIICEECITHYSCCRCGCNIEYENDLIIINDNYYCADCASNLDHCSYCDELVDLDNDSWSFEFDIGKIDKDEITYCKDSFNDAKVIITCEHCMKKIFVNGKSEMTLPHERIDRDWWSASLALVPIENMTEYGLSIINEKELENLGYRKH